MKENVEKAKTTVRNFWKLALSLSMITLAGYNLYQVRGQLATITAQVFIAVAAAVVVVEGIVQLVKFLSKK